MEKENVNYEQLYLELLEKNKQNIEIIQNQQAYINKLELTIRVLSNVLGR